MNKIISAFEIRRSLFITAGFAMLLALTMMVGFQYASAAEINITADSNLSLGSTGQGVVVLQGLMSEMGYLQVPAGVAFGYYGPLTQAAVARYQVSRGITPAVGYFGPITKISMNQDFATRGWLMALGW